MIRIPKSEYVRRRKALMVQTEFNSIAILPAAPMYIRNRDVGHVYRQDSDFQYPTGFLESEAAMALIPGRAHGEYALFCRERDPERELWDGLRAGQNGAIGQYGVDDAFPIDDIDDIPPGLIEGRDRVYYALGANPDLDHQLMDRINVICPKARQGAQPSNEFVALDHLPYDQRLYKSTNEVKVMRYAAEVSARAHIRAMEVCRPGLFEYHLEAELEYEFCKDGAKMPACGSTVAAECNVCILYYRENDTAIKDGDPILTDAGYEIDCYISDITRTFPANGCFSPEQKAIYELVLGANVVTFDHIAPGHHWNEAHEATVRVTTAGPACLGLLEGDVNELTAHEAYRVFYMHRAGHWLGMDMHDIDEHRVDGEWRAPEPGMAMTVELGIYTVPDSTSVAKKWRGIGARIEDDMVITRNDCEVLANGVPRIVAEIEALMAAAESEAV